MSPNINGFHLDMPFDEVKQLTHELGYGSLKLVSKYTNNMYFVESKDNNKQIGLVFNIINNKLNRLQILNWKEFFELNDVTFENLIDIFQNYFLKKFEYKKEIDEYDGESMIIEYFGNNWSLYFDFSDESIRMTDFVNGIIRYP